MYADALFLEQPDWSRHPGRRLALNLLPATLVVAVVLMALRLPAIEQSLPVADLFVRILVDDDEQLDKPPFVEEELVEAPVTEPLRLEDAPANDLPVEPPPAVLDMSEPGRSTDWYARIPDAVEAYEASKPREYSINPGMDERRRVAAEKYYRSRAPAQQQTSDNVERDNLGRTILVIGGCHRVIDDPNVGSRDMFLTFGQFLVFCSNRNGEPQELGFVKELRNRREGQVRYGHPAVE